MIQAASAIAALRARRHQPPTGWDAGAFERLTDALAAALAAAWHHDAETDTAREDRPELHG